MVTNSKVLGSCQTAAPIGTTFGTRRRIRLGMDIGQIQFAPKYPRGILVGFFLWGQQSKCLGKLSNGWTDWHQIWYESADSSANRHRLNTIRLSIPQGFLGGHKFKGLLKLSNGSTDWHQMWHTCADSSGIGYTPNKLPVETQWRHLGGFKGSNIQKS